MNNNKYMQKIKAFTLAEMMILLLITSIVLAATLPIALKQRAGEDASLDSTMWRTTGFRTVFKNATSPYNSVIIGLNDIHPLLSKLELNSSGLVIDTDNYTENQISFFNNSSGMIAKMGDFRIFGSTSLTQSLFIGENLMNYNSSIDQNNIGIGSEILSYSTGSGRNNLGIGYKALGIGDGNDNVAIGDWAGFTQANTTSSIFIGSWAGAMAGAISGENYRCTHIGSEAGYNLSGGCFRSIFIGEQAGRLLKNPNTTIAIGKSAFRNPPSDADYGGISNIAIGISAMEYGGRSSYYNIAIGTRAAYKKGKGNYITAIGRLACTKFNESGISGSYKTCIGDQSANSDATAGWDPDNNTKQVVIGKLRYDAADGTTSRSSTIFISARGAYAPSGTMTSYSDIRKKNIIKKYDEISLEKFRKIKTYIFALKDDPTQKKQVGILAQEMKEIIPQSVKKQSSGYYTYANMWLIYATVNIVNELNHQVQNLTNDIKIQVLKMALINNDIKGLEKDFDNISQENINIKDEIAKTKKKLAKLENNKG